MEDWFFVFVFLYVIRLRFSSRTCFTKAILQSSTASSLFQSDAFILYSLSVDYLVVEGQQRYYYSMTSYPLGRHHHEIELMFVEITITLQTVTRYYS
jgi:hypothetical protein